MNRAILLFVLTVSIIGCVSRPLTKVEVRNLEGEWKDPGKTIEHTYGFIEALQNGFFDVNAKTSSEQTFYSAIENLMNGTTKDAEPEFKLLSESADDSLLKKYAKEILLNIYFDQSQWSELQRSLPDTGSGAQMGKLFTKAYRDVPPEIYDFHTSDTPILFTLQHGIPCVEVRINGKVKKFLLDTGAGLSVVSSEVADECGLRSLTTAGGDAGTATSKQVKFNPTLIDSLLLGNVVIRNHPAMIIDKKDLHIKMLGIFTVLKIEGIIGWNAIRNFNLEIDFKKLMLTIRKPEQSHQHKKNLFWLGYPLVITSDQNGTPLIFGVDTGAKRSSITHQLLKKINKDSLSDQKILIGSAGGTEKIASKTLPALDIRINDRLLHFTKIGTSVAKSGVFFKRDGTLGNDVAQGRILRIDYMNGRYEIE